MNDYAKLLEKAKKSIPPETALQQIKRAEEFLDFTRSYLKEKGLLGD